MNKVKVLIFAAEKGYLELVRAMVERGANIHVQDNYALRITAEEGHLAIVKYLVEQGANIHAQDDYALRMAEKYHQQEVVKYIQNIKKNNQTLPKI